jgi:putative tryptophan/tyrosine transport system substrate-binding protein
VPTSNWPTSAAAARRALVVSFPDGGGLMSYGPDLTYLFQRLGSYVFKILHGARPADLPIERPTKFELVINLRAAKALAVTVPASLLNNADEVIE